MIFTLFRKIKILILIGLCVSVSQKHQVAFCNQSNNVPALPLSMVNFLSEPIGSIKIEPIFFSSGKYELSAEGKEVLSELAKKLSGFEHYLLIEAFTDSIGSNEQNNLLSQKRAAEAREYLVSTGHLQSNQIISVGHGKIFASDSNNEDVRKSDRKIVVTVMRLKSSHQTQSALVKELRVRGIALEHVFDSQDRSVQNSSPHHQIQDATPPENKLAFIALVKRPLFNFDYSDELNEQGVLGLQLFITRIKNQGLIDGFVPHLSFVLSRVEVENYLASASRISIGVSYFHHLWRHEFVTVSNALGFQVNRLSYTNVSKSSGESNTDFSATNKLFRNKFEGVVSNQTFFQFDLPRYNTDAIAGAEISLSNILVGFHLSLGVVFKF